MNRADLKRNMLQRVFQKAAHEGLIPDMRVGAVMTPRPFTVRSDCSARKLISLFDEKRFRHFLVADSRQLLGVISDRDVIRLFGITETAEAKYLEKVTAGELMSTDLITVSPTAFLAEAVTLIVDHGINCLPVVEGAQPVGILTSTDIFLSLEQVLLSVVLLRTPELLSSSGGKR